MPLWCASKLASLSLRSGASTAGSTQLSRQHKTVEQRWQLSHRATSLGGFVACQRAPIGSLQAL